MATPPTGAAFLHPQNPRTGSPNIAALRVGNFLQLQWHMEPLLVGDLQQHLQTYGERLGESVTNGPMAGALTMQMLMGRWLEQRSSVFVDDVNCQCVANCGRDFLTVIKKFSHRELGWWIDGKLSPTQSKSG
jgi:hypothetical protein